MTSEELPKISRITPEIAIAVGGISCRATYDNTYVQYYTPPWVFMSHCAVAGTEQSPDEPLRLFSGRYVVSLSYAGYPRRLDPYPTDAVLADYIAQQEVELQEELDEL